MALGYTKCTKHIFGFGEANQNYYFDLPVICNKTSDYTIIRKIIVDDEEVASDEMTVKVNPIVVFDHYFTEIDESLVETSSLLVKTSDSSVFTKNTNVVSNFDDVYVIECASVEEARYVYSYYVDKVDSISDFSKVMSIATDENLL